MIGVPNASSSDGSTLVSGGPAIGPIGGMSIGMSIGRSGGASVASGGEPPGSKPNRPQAAIVIKPARTTRTTPSVLRRAVGYRPMSPSGLVLALALALGAGACGRPAPARPLPPMTHEAYAHYLDGKLAAYRDRLGRRRRVARARREGRAGSADDRRRARACAARRRSASRRARRRSRPRARSGRSTRRCGSRRAICSSTTTRGRGDRARTAARSSSSPPTSAPTSGSRSSSQPARRASATLRAARQEGSRRRSTVTTGSRSGSRTRSELARPRSRELRAVLERDPDHIDARLDLARALRRSGKLDEAIAQTRSAFDRSGQALDIAEELYWLLCEADDRTAAIDLLTLLDDDRSDVDALAAVARLAARPRPARRRRARSRSRIADGRSRCRRSLLAEAELDTSGDPQARGEAAARDRAATRSGSPRRAGSPATSLLATGDPKRALDAIAPAREPTPEGSRPRARRRVRARRCRRCAPVRARCSRRSATRSARSSHARASRITLGDAAAALAILEPLLVKHPDSTTRAQPRRLPARRSRTSGSPMRSAGSRHARDLAPGDPAILDSWGWLLLQQGKARDAVRALDRAARFAPNEAEILVHLAAAWAADGAPRTAAGGARPCARACSPSPRCSQRIEAVRATLPPRR